MLLVYLVLSQESIFVSKKKNSKGKNVTGSYITKFIKKKLKKSII